MISLCILQGGSSIEKDVSVASTKYIIENINKEKYNINIINIENTKNIQWINELEKIKPDVVLSTLHGCHGESGAVCGVLDCMGIKYIGTGVLGSAITQDKSISKFIMSKNNIQTPEYVCITYDNWELYKLQIENMTFPVIVKPNIGGSSIGICVCNDIQEVKKQVQKVSEICEKIIIERFVNGYEVVCTVVEIDGQRKALPIQNVVGGIGGYDTESAYYNNKQTKVRKSSLVGYVEDMIKTTAVKVYDITRCEGYARVDFIVDDEQIYVLEVNSIPGLTEFSSLPKAVESYFGSFGKFLDILINDRLNKKR